MAREAIAQKERSLLEFPEILERRELNRVGDFFVAEIETGESKQISQSPMGVRMQVFVLHEADRVERALPQMSIEEGDDLRHLMADELVQTGVGEGGVLGSHSRDLY